MRKGYSSELTKSKDALQNVKGHMEALYAKGDSAHIEQDPLLKEECAASIKVAEAALNSFAGSIKAIKVAVEAWHSPDLWGWSLGGGSQSKREHGTCPESTWTTDRSSKGTFFNPNRNTIVLGSLLKHTIY